MRPDCCFPSGIPSSVCCAPTPPPPEPPDLGGSGRLAATPLWPGWSGAKSGNRPSVAFEACRLIFSSEIPSVLTKAGGRADGAVNDAERSMPGNSSVSEAFFCCLLPGLFVTSPPAPTTPLCASEVADEGGKATLALLKTELPPLVFPPIKDKAGVEPALVLFE